MLHFFLIVLLLYAVLVGFLYSFQQQLIYHPDKRIGSPGTYGLEGFTEYFIDTIDGETLHVWYRAAAPGFPTIVYYHGNAYHMGTRGGMYGALADKGFGVLALSYRGYGKSTGSPHERGIYTDARTAIDFLKDKFGIAAQRLMLFGESLGTGVAVQMATEHDVGALILEAPYTSIAARAAEIYRFIPVKLLIRERYHTLKKIGRVKAPLLLFHGELDPTIPIEHGHAVFTAATSPKEAFFLPHTAHNDFDSGVISAHVLAFAKKHQLITQ